MQWGIKELQWFEYFKVEFLEILKMLLCWISANQVSQMSSIFLKDVIVIPHIACYNDWA